MQYLTEILRGWGDTNWEQKRERERKSEGKAMLIFPVVCMILKNGRTGTGVKKLFQIIGVCFFKSFFAVRVHEISAYIYDLFQHCSVFVLCSQWQCNAHSCATEGSAHFVLSVFLMLSPCFPACVPCCLLFTHPLCGLLYSYYLCLYI